MKIIAKDVLKYYDSRTNESEIKSIRKRIADIQEEADSAANAFIEAKNPLLKQRIEKRMQECEILLSDLEKLKAQLILERGQKLSESDIISFVKIILKGDINDIEFKRRLIDNLVYKVYISDDNTYIYFNIKGGNNIEEITLEDTMTALKSAKKFKHKVTLPAKQILNRTPKFGLGFFLTTNTVFRLKTSNFEPSCKIRLY